MIEIAIIAIIAIATHSQRPTHLSILKSFGFNPNKAQYRIINPIISSKPDGSLSRKDILCEFNSFTE